MSLSSVKKAATVASNHAPWCASLVALQQIWGSFVRRREVGRLEEKDATMALDEVQRVHRCRTNVLKKVTGRTPLEFVRKESRVAGYAVLHCRRDPAHGACTC